MKKQIHKFCLWWMPVLCCMACTQAEPPATGTDDWVQIQPVVSGYYLSLSSPRQTRADNTTLQGAVIYPLEDGSTLRLLVYTKNASSDKFEIQSKYSKAYVIRNSGASSLLYPCEVDDDGALLPGDNSTPLYLPEGTYAFRILSPAKKLNSANWVEIGNGEYLLATDDRYEQTKMKEAERIEKTGQVTAEIRTLQLSPIINQTARICFIIRKGEGIHSLEMLPEGIEINGLQNQVTDTGFDWANGDTLVMKKGDKNASVRIKQYTKQENGNALVAHTGILPTDARAHSISVLFNLKVNGNPTQYQMLLNNTLLQAGHSYNFEATVRVNEGVTVLTWQNRSWTENVEMDNKSNT